MTQTMKQISIRVALSGFHNGQAVEPKVKAKAAGTGRVEVELSWFDHSDRSESKPETFRGTVADAERWLRAKGVHLGAQGICW